MNSHPHVTAPVPSPATVTESARIVQTLRRDIVLGILPAGTPLVERTLGARFNVASRLPVREALRQLKAEALIDHEPRRRATVRPFSGRDLANTAEVFELIDTLAVRHAALRRDPNDLARMREHVDGGVRALAAQDGPALSIHAREFRNTIFQASRNSTLLEIKHRIEARVWRMVEHKARHTDPSRLYDGLYQAILAQDADAAESVFSTYMRQWRDIWRISDVNRIEARLSGTPSTPEPEKPQRRGAPATSGFTPEGERIAAILRQQITDGVRMPGSPLAERQIAQEFAVSRSPVTEAVTLLVFEGLAVAPKDRSAALVRGLPQAEQADFHAVCAALDTAAAALAAERATTEHIEHMRLLVEDEERMAAQGDVQGLRDKGRAWREALYHMTENDVLDDTARLLHGRFQLRMVELQDAVTMSRSHRLVFEAIESRQPGVATAVIQRAFAVDSASGTASPE